MQLIRMPRRAAVFIALCRRVAAIVLLCAAPQAMAASVCVASAAEIECIDVSSGQSLKRVPLASVRQLAGTSEGGVWAMTATSVAYVAAANLPVTTVDVAALGYGVPTLLAADPYDHSAWIVTSKNLLAHFDIHGGLQSGQTLPGPASALGVALDQTLWVAGPRELWQVAGSRLDAALPIDRAWSAPVAALAVDSLRDRLWMVGRSAIARLDSSGAGSPMMIVGVGSAIRSSVLDPKTGYLWLLTSAELIAYDESGQRNAAIPLTSLDADGASALSYDGAADALVVTAPAGVRVIDRDRAMVASVDRPALSGMGVAEPFHVLPGLSLLRPPPDANTAERQPAFILQLESLCNGAPCALPPGYVESLRLIASVDGASVADQFRLDPNTSQSTYVPSSPLPLGTSLFSAQVVDRFGHESDTVTSRLTLFESKASVHILAGNAAPQVSLIAPANNATFVPGSNITLTATAADSDGTIAKVDFYRGGNTLLGTATTGPAYTIIWQNVPAGTYSLTAKATDNKNGTKTSTAVSIKVVQPPNVAPTVSITSPANGAAVNGPNITINATANDSDGTVTKVDFYDGSVLLGTFGGGTATVNATGTLANASGGAHTLKATATDNAGATASATVNVTVNAAPYVVLTAPANCSTVISPASITLTADALDTDGSVTRIDFYDGAMLLGSVTRRPYAITWPNAPLGTHSLTAVAADNQGASRTSNPVTVTVLTPDVPPTISLTAPAEGTVFGVGAPVTVAANAADSDGTINKVEFYAGATLIGNVATPPYTTTWSPAATGSYTLTAKATDNRGVATTSGAVHVSAVTNSPPNVTLTAPTSGTSYLASAPVNLAATASDSDGTIQKVEFLWGLPGTTPSNLIAAPASPPYTATWSNSTGGSFLLMAKVTDNLGGTANSNTVSISVDSAPVVAITTPADNSAFATGAPVTITVHATDADGTLSLVELLSDQGRNATCTTSPPPSVMNCPFTYQGLGSLAAGVYTFTGRATDNLGAVTLSAPIHITVNSAPTVTLTAPAAGISYAPPAAIDLAATASSTVGSISKVEFFAGTTLIGTKFAPPFTATWSNVPLGSYSLTAKVTDNLGATATSTAVPITVDPFALNITSPADYTTVYDTTAIVAGTFAGGTPTSITVNGQNAVLGNGTFAAAVPLVTGSNALAVVATLPGGGSVSRSIGVTSAQTSFTVTNHSSGQTVNDDSTDIRGVVSAAPNSALLVNGQLATIDSTGSFFVNSVPLKAGSNALALTLNTQDGASIQQTLNLTSDGLAPFRMDVSPDNGIAAPLTVTVTLTNRGLTSYGWVDVNGHRFDAPPTPVSQTIFNVTYPQPGTYTMTVVVRNPQGTSIWVGTHRIRVGTVADLDTTARGVYTGMLNKLRVGNISGALNAVTSSVRDKYSAIFNAIGSNWPSVVDRLGIIRAGRLSEDLVEYIVVRDKADGAYGYSIYLIRGDNGLWSLEGM